MFVLKRQLFILVLLSCSAVREDSSSNFTHRFHGWQHLFKDVRIDTLRRTND